MEAQRAALLAATGAGRRDPDRLAAGLEQYLASQLGASRVSVSGLCTPAGAGVSNETFLFEAGWEDGGTGRQEGMVLRFAPGAVQLFPDADLVRQYRLLEALQRERLVRVPEPLWLCEDGDVLGGAFFLMRRLEGRVPVSSPVYNAAGFLFDATPAQRRRAWTSAVEELARIHRVPPDAVGFLSHPDGDGNRQQVEYWDRYLGWSLGTAAPDSVLALAEWVRRACPGPGVVGLSWGDARIGNMVFDEGFRLTGVIDWEQASLGGARHDLGWWLVFDEFHSTGHGVARLDGLGTRGETIALWEDRTGDRAGDLRWYEAFAGLKLALIAARTFVVGGRPPADAAGVAAALVRDPCALAGVG